MIKEFFAYLVEKTNPLMYYTDYSPRPFRILIDITDRCNLRCPTCSRWKTKNKEELTSEQWKFVLKKIRNFSITNYLTIAGGEPFVRKDLIEILKYTKKLRFKVCLLTNGFTLTEDKIRELSAIGVEDINISLNSLDKDKHDRSRNTKGSWKKITDLIPKLKNYKINSNISIILTKENLEEVPEIAKMMKKHFLNCLNIQVLADKKVHSPFSANNIPMIEKEWYKHDKYWIDDINKLSKVVKKLIIMKRQGYRITNTERHLKNIINYYKNPDSILKYKCLSSISSMVIDPYGDIRFCDYGSEKLGNILQSDPKKLWNGKKSRKYRKRLKRCRRTCRMLNSNGFLK